MRRRLLVLAAALAGAAAAPGDAGAAEAKLAEAQSARFPDRAFVLSLPESSRLEASQIDLRENGERVENLQVVPGDQAGPRAFGVVLAIDASESMRGEAIEQAVAAARAFAERRKPNQALGLLFFSRGQQVALAPTTDGAKIRAALASPPALTKGTRIYDAGLAALEMLRAAQVRAGSVVVLSDGGDVGSEATAGALADAARRQRARVYTVGLASPSFRPGTLADIAAASGGVYTEASSSRELRRIYGALSAQLASEYLVTYRSLAPAGQAVQVEVRTPGLTAPAVASYDAPALPAAAAVAAPADGGPWNRTPVLVAVALLVGGLLALALWLVVRGPRAGVAARIGAYTGPTESSLFDTIATERRSALSALATGAARRLRWWPRFVLQVELSGVALTPGQVAGATAGATAVLVWAFASVGRPLAAVLCLLVPVAVVLVLRSRVDRMRRDFADQLADNLQVVASAMRAGHSFEGGLAVAAEDAAEPMRSELRRIVSDERLGIPLEEAMVTVARRMDNREFDQVATVITAQRQTGGNVAELLDRAVESLRHRGELRRLVQGLTAQGRTGGAVVSAMPFVIAFALSLISPGYFDPMLEEPLGKALMVMAFLSIGAGWLIIRKIVDIKV